MNIVDIIKPNEKFYKFVKKENEKYYSFYNSKFEYKLGEVVTAILGNKDFILSNSGLHCGLIQEVEDFTYKGNQDAVLIELELQSYDDVIDLDGIRLKKAKFIREVPYSEYEKYLQ